MSLQYVIPIFVPHLGCPNDCTFCNQKSISGQTKQVTAEDVKQTIEEYLKSFKVITNLSFYKSTFYQVWLHMAEDSERHSEINYYFCIALCLLSL